jgi:hypothetical protein
VVDEIGKDIKDRYSERRLGNFIRIGRNAEAKTGAALSQPGEVSPRVAMKVLEEGSWCNGPVMSEYFGGILANSRSVDGTDDRGMTWAALVSRLATEDVHLHFLVYDAIRSLHLEKGRLGWGLGVVRNGAETYVSESEVAALMGRPVDLSAPLTALVREGLIGDVWSAGPIDHLSEQSIDPPERGMTVTPSIPGIQLFMWAFNNGLLPLPMFSDPKLPFASHEGLVGLTKARLVQEMKTERNERLRLEAGIPPVQEDV